MKLTKKKTKEFIDLVKDYKNSDINVLKKYLDDYPTLINLRIAGMAKGIDDFSSLMLAIRYLNFEFAETLVAAGADVNYIDESPARYYHYPLFFDLIQMMILIIESEKIDIDRKNELLEMAFALWDIMAKNGLDYSLTSPKTEITNPENCLSAAIRLIGARYDCRHRIHYESEELPENQYQFSEESRDLEKEKAYSQILEKIINNIPAEIIDSVDCSRHRHWSLAMLPFFEKNGYVDLFSLEIANEMVQKKWGRNLPNYRGEWAFKSLDERITQFADRV